MKSVYLLMVTISLALTSCASTHPVNDHTPIPAKPKATCKHKDPMKVSFYTRGNPKMPYVVVGNATISKFNNAGNKRQEATIHDAMRSTAAMMGGDAIINIRNHGNTVTGTVIAYPSEQITV